MAHQSLFPNLTDEAKVGCKSFLEVCMTKGSEFIILKKQVEEA